MKLEEIRKLVEAATPGPWPDTDYGPINSEDEAYGHCAWTPPCSAADEEQEIAQAQDDARFIAAARTLMPRLLAVAEAAKRVMDSSVSLRDYHDVCNELDVAITALEEDA